MKKVKTTLIWVMAVFCLNQTTTTFCKAQTLTLEEQRLQRYWNYRERFKRYFARIGPDAGFGLPASNRNPDFNCGSYGAGTTSFMRWGDTGAQLGDYLAVLATEYRLLKDQGGDVQPTLNELYYALYAFNRVDKKAEPYLSINEPNPQPENLNGFFMRDDVEELMYKEWYDNYALSGNDPNFDLHCVDGDAYSIENWASGGPSFTPYNEHNEESQDQMIGLMLGLVHITKLVDNVYVKPLASDDGFYIVDETKAITTRMMSYVTANYDFDMDVDAVQISNGATLGAVGSGALASYLFSGGSPSVTAINAVGTFIAISNINSILSIASPNEINFTSTNWVLLNPITGKSVNSGGCWLQPWSYGFSKAAEAITGTSWNIPLHGNVAYGQTNVTLNYSLNGMPKDYWNCLAGTDFSVADNCLPIIGPLNERFDLCSFTVSRPFWPGL